MKVMVLEVEIICVNTADVLSVFTFQCLPCRFLLRESVPAAGVLLL